MKILLFVLTTRKVPLEVKIAAIGIEVLHGTIDEFFNIIVSPSVFLS